jgi:aryl-alcohol dehydrogenase-like predicted oxidoreductase
MKVHNVPGTDLALSVVGLGCWALGGEHWGDDVDDTTSIATVHAALDAGINWVDTAPLYGAGHADEVVVRALRQADRSALIATKVGARTHGRSGHAESDLSPEHLRADLDASLQRLGLDCIDLLQVHWPCERGTPLEDTFGTLVVLQQEGKVRHLGVCNYDAPTLRRIVGLAPIATIQVPLSLLRREIEATLLPTARELGVGVLAYEPLCRGLLTGKYPSPPTFPASDMRARDDRFRGARFVHASRFVRDLERAAARVGVPTAAAAIGWVADQPGIIAAIAGAKRPDQVRDNAQASRLIGSKVTTILGRLATLHGGHPR